MFNVRMDSRILHYSTIVVKDQTWDTAFTCPEACIYMSWSLASNFLIALYWEMEKEGIDLTNICIPKYSYSIMNENMINFLLCTICPK